MKTGSVAAGGRRQARRAANSDVMEAAARAGFVARGVIYVLVGLLALRIAFSDSGAGQANSAGKQADRGGAVAEIAEQPFGNAVLWLLGAALAGMAVWRLSEALFGQAGADGNTPAKRAMAAARFVFYGFVSYSVLSYASGDSGSGSGSSDRQTGDVTARLLDRPGGQWMVAAVGAAVVAVGLWMAVQAVRRTYRKHLKMSRMTAKTRRGVDVLGVFGGASRGAVFTAAGGFALAAAAGHEAGKAKGMDDTLRSFTETPVGPWLLVPIALGLAAFGVLSWVNARWRTV